MIIFRSSELQEEMKSYVKINMWISLNEYWWCKTIEFLMGFEMQRIKIATGML